MRNVVGVIAALMLTTACANEKVISVPGCACEGETCSVASCGENRHACELPDGTLCGSPTGFSMCADANDVPTCANIEGEPIEGTFVCVSVEDRLALEPCE